MANVYPTQQELVDYIRKTAPAKGINPDVAVAVADAEGLKANPAEGWQSRIVNKQGVREPSFGVYQLYMGGGLGNEFQKATGLDPSDPRNVYAGIDFALDHVSKKGWSAFHGAKNNGIGEWDGVLSMDKGVPRFRASTPQTAEAATNPGLGAPAITIPPGAGVTEPVTGAVPGMQQAPADMNYEGGVYPVTQTNTQAYVRNQNFRSMAGLPVGEVSYGETWQAAQDKLLFTNEFSRLSKSWSFQNDPNWNREKELPAILKNVPTDYWHRFANVNSAIHAEWTLEQVAKEQKWDATIAANGWTGVGSSMFFEVFNPMTLAGGVGAELAATRMIGGALKATRAARMARSGLTGLAGNVGSEAALDAVDSRRHTAMDYSIAAGAGFLLGGALGIFNRGKAPVDHQNNRQLMAVGRQVLMGENGGSAGAAYAPSSRMTDNAAGAEVGMDWADIPDAEPSMGRKIGNVLSNLPLVRNIVSPITKAERLGATAFSLVRGLLPDPRGARGREVVQMSVVEDRQMTIQALIGKWQTVMEPQYDKWAKRTLSGNERAKYEAGFNDTAREKFTRLVDDYVWETDAIKREAFDPEVKLAGDEHARIMEETGRIMYELGMIKDIEIPNAPITEEYEEVVPVTKEVTKTEDTGIRTYEGSLETFHGYSDRPTLPRREFTQAEKQAELDAYIKRYNNPNKLTVWAEPPKDIAEAEALGWFEGGFTPLDDKWTKTFRTGTTRDEAGRYGDSVFGDDNTVYLDGDGKWIGGRVERFSVQEAIRVSNNFKNALVIEPDNYEKVLDIVFKSEGKIDGKSIAAWAKKNGHDGIIVNGFDPLADKIEEINAGLIKKYGDGTEIFQDQVAVFDPATLTPGKRVKVGKDAPLGTVGKQIKGKTKTATRTFTEKVDETTTVKKTREVEQPPTIIKWEPDQHYSPLLKDEARFLEINDKFAEADIKRLVEEAFKRDTPKLEGALLRRMVDGYLDNLRKANFNIRDPMERIMAATDRNQIRAFLAEDLGITDTALVDEFLNLPGIKKLSDKGAATPRLKRRAFSNEGYMMKMKLPYRDGYTGKRVSPDGEELSIRDFFIRNADHQMQRYISDVSGPIALAKFKIRDGKTGDMVMDGIRSDADWAKYKEMIISSSRAEKPNAGTDINDLIEELDYVYNIVAKNGASNPRMAKVGRRINQTMFNLLMQNLGVNSIQEVANTIATTSVINTFKGVPAMRRMLDEAGRSVPVDKVRRELEALMGVGHKNLLGSEHYVAKANRTGDENISGALGETFDYANGKVQSAVMKASGFQYIDNKLQIGAVQAMAFEFEDMAKKYAAKLDAETFKVDDLSNGFFKAQDAKRMRGLGMDDAKLTKVLNNIRKHGMELEKWDAASVADFRLALHRYYRRAIQQQDVGNLSRWLSHPVAKVMLAFRSFMLVGMDKQFLYGLNHFDGRQAWQWTLNVALAGSVWYLYQKALSMGQKNPEEYMKRKFGEPGSYQFYASLGAAGFARSGFSTVVPSIWDTFAPAAGLPAFNSRTSGTSMSALWGAPFMSEGDNILKSIGIGATLLTEDRQLSRSELNTLYRTFLGNHFAPLILQGLATQDRAELPPRTK